MTDQVAQLRGEYEKRGLIEGEMAADPISQFREWFDGARQAGLEEPNAFVLGTADIDGRPSARAVLMKGLDERGLVFYTNLLSRKSNELRQNPRAAAAFVWIPLHRQVRFEGGVTIVDDDEADRYFETRPRGAQVAAHASRQSSIVGSREQLDQAFRSLDERFEGQEISRPSSWGGWRLSPDVVEFWQGQPNRFHDRVRYVKNADTWSKERLAP